MCNFREKTYQRRYRIFWDTIIQREIRFGNIENDMYAEGQGVGGGESENFLRKRVTLYIKNDRRNIVISLIPPRTMRFSRRKIVSPLHLPMGIDTFELSEDVG